MNTPSTKKSVSDYANKAGAVTQNGGSVVFPAWENLTTFYKLIVTDVINDFVALQEHEESQNDPSVITDVEPKPSTATNPYHGPAIDDAVGILHNLGYTYQMTENGLAWVRSPNLDTTLVQ